jgi:hypothetical protein
MNPPDKPSTNDREISVWRLIAGFVTVLALVAVILVSISEGKIYGKRGSSAVVLSEDPKLFWLIIIGSATYTAVIAYQLSRSKLKPRRPISDSPVVTRDWMGNVVEYGGSQNAPTKAPEPTPTSVMPAAEQPSRRP